MSNNKEKNILGITSDKQENFSKWYLELCEKAELISYTDISGCYVLRPWAYSIWEKIQQFFNPIIYEDGVQNCYFPCFVSQNALMTEATHIEGFKPEVAWVTKAGNSDLSEPIAVRPTSETIIYPIFSKWVRSHRDLPLRVNQWCNVVRWEFKRAVPFIRSREFLWQEGHSAFSNAEDANKEVLNILNIYKRIYEELLAVPVILGKKTEAEKFPGGMYTTTCEAYIPTNGRAVQAATSHCLGQNFSSIFNISFENQNQEKSFAWQNCWGLSTRSLGIMFMIHGDNDGLVLPPNVAPIQIVIIPIFRKTQKDLIISTCDTLHAVLKNKFRVKVDYDEVHSVGVKFNHWDLKGVPLRIDIGDLELKNNILSLKRRDTGEKFQLKNDENLISNISQLFEKMHIDMLNKSKSARDESLGKTQDKNEFIQFLNKKKMVLIPFCEKRSCEEDICAYTQNNSNAHESDIQFELTGKAKSLCIPFEQPELKEGTKCIYCNDEARSWTLFGRSY